MGARLTINQDLGEYRVAEFLGAGGMGEVYRAVHRSLGRDYAIKVMDAGGAGEARFENEARIQASLPHPNIAAMHAYFEHRGRRCLVMEFVPGETLASRLRREGRIAPEDALRILAQVAAAAAFMHARGIVHRDLTPANVRLTPDGRIKVLDFGIATIEHRKGLTAEGHVIGTPAYLSPEQLRTGKATPQSDVWALGVLLFEMIAGEPPFRGTYPTDVWREIEKGRRPDLGDVLPSDDPHRTRVETILGRSLAVDPAARFANAGELAAAVAANPTHRAHVPRGHRSHTGPTYPRTHHALPALTFALAVILILATLGYYRWGTTVCCAPIEPVSVHRIDVSQGVADVVIDGRRLGRTPYDYQAARGETVTLELRQQGFLPVREEFVITERPVWTFPMRRQP